jgi:SAM-dependent methyltransferase
LDIKKEYANNLAKPKEDSIYLNKRLFDTYNNIVNLKLNKKLFGTNIDLGSGDKGFSEICKTNNIISYPYDYPEFDIEKDTLLQLDDSIDFVTMNAVIEHIKDPSNILKEINRVLKNEGLLFIRTPNWQMDFKNFFNDPTHVKPYSPATIRSTLKLVGFEIIFLEPGLIGKSTFWWNLPDKLKWKVASLIKGGTKSILCVAVKK